LEARDIKRVVLLGPSAETWKGGIAQFTSRLAEELGRRADLEYFSWTEIYPKFLLRREFRDTVSSQATTSARAQFVLGYLNPLSWLRLARLIRRFDPDLILLTWSHPVHAPVYLCLQWLLGRDRPVQFICHNVLPHEPFFGARLLTRWCLRKSERLIVHGTSEQRAIASLPATKPEILELFLPLHDFFGERLPRRGNGHDLLFFGHIRPYKGLDVLLRAMPRVRERFPNVRLTIAGELFYSGDTAAADAKSNPLALIDQLGLGATVSTDIRYIPNEQIAELMSRADVCVFPYRSATQSGGITVAFAYGVPVVSTRVGGIPDVVVEGQSGLLVEPDDAEGLANALISILENPITTDSVDRIAASLSWERYVARILSREGPNPER